MNRADARRSAHPSNTAAAVQSAAEGSHTAQMWPYPSYHHASLLLLPLTSCCRCRCVVRICLADSVREICALSVSSSTRLPISCKHRQRNAAQSKSSWVVALLR